MGEGSRKVGQELFLLLGAAQIEDPEGYKRRQPTITHMVFEASTRMTFSSSLPRWALPVEQAFDVGFRGC